MEVAQTHSIRKIQPDRRSGIRQTGAYTIRCQRLGLVIINLCLILLLQGLGMYFLGSAERQYHYL